ncbi:hypothetical protein GUJ93_ZPchr0002g26243 [Zizania palustris]|uniref:Trehalose 6-phosphate phosphatase n=1 Tax=Zizania palustris TaxID=103762 RepID=A0A8J5S2Y7_ZIZPA|nr:hypothetical protein GUJ93_ZPchr0002g26243 [Zizania palustris]
MTNQDVVVSEMGISAGGAALPGAGGPALFACRSAAAGAMSMRQAYLDLAAVAAAARSASCTWAEAMRASSPTRSSRSAADVDEFTAWVRKHPSALSEFEQIAGASKGKKIVMFLDYDGTLSPIVADPDAAFMSDAMRAAVREVAKRFPTAIVSGRCRDKVRNFVGLSELYYAGSHGMDIKGPSSNVCSPSSSPPSRNQPEYRTTNRTPPSHHSLMKISFPHANLQPESVLCQPASEFLPMIDEVYKALVEKTKSTPGAKVENNKFCLSVHFRCVDEKRWNALGEQVKDVIKEYPLLKLTQGRKVLEIRPSIKWDKGKALEFLLESLGFANSSDVLPVYIGDDRTDEDAFKVLRKRGQGLGILVSKFPKETNASYSLQDPDEVMEFLLRLVEWTRKPSSSSSSSMIRPRVS